MTVYIFSLELVTIETSPFNRKQSCLHGLSNQKKLSIIKIASTEIPVEAIFMMDNVIIPIQWLLAAWN
jgi:hypothetical protein